MPNKMDSAFWAMYYNTAVNNLWTIFRVIGEENSEIGTKEKFDGGKDDLKRFAALKILESPKNLAKKGRVVKAFKRYLPILAVYEQYKENPGGKTKTQNKEKAGNKTQICSPEDVYDFLNACGSLLLEIRNHFSHVIRNDKPDITETLKIIRTIYNANLRTVKERFYAKGNEDEKLFKSFRLHVGKNKNFGCLTPLTAQNNGSIEFTEWGYAFFASFFLTKDDVWRMTDTLIRKIGNQSLQNADKKQLLGRIFTVRALRSPQPRLVCDEISPHSLGMDILSELTRVPSLLFDFLSTADQKRFRVTQDYRELYRTPTLQEQLLKRYGDRYPYLALSYLDRAQKLPRTRFHLNLGTFSFRKHERPLIDGSTLTDRTLKKRILAFARIQDAEKEYLEKRQSSDSLYWNPLTSPIPAGTSYRTDVMPQYYIKDNQIGIYFKDENEARYRSPEIAENQKLRNEHPVCWLSLYELPILVFLTAAGKGREAENILFDYQKRWESFLAEVKENDENTDPETLRTKFNLQESDIPSQLRDALQLITRRGKRDDLTDRIKIEINELVKKAEHTKKSIQNEQSYDFKLGKRRSSRFTSGRLAATITKELLLFQPAVQVKNKEGKNKEEKEEKKEKVKGNGKIGSPDFAVLQESLALYSQTKGDLRNLFEKARLLNNERYPHPFLNEVLKKRAGTLQEFYTHYLDKKIEFLKNLKTAINEEMNLDYETGSFYIFRRVFRRAVGAVSLKNNKSVLKKFINNMNEQPANLPRGLFAELVQTTVSEKFPDRCRELPGFGERSKGDGENYEKGKPKYNSTYLIMKYHEWSGDAQPWYASLKKSKNNQRFKKLFTLLDKDKELDNQSVTLLRKKIKQTPEKNKPLLKGLLNCFDQAEKSLRHERIRDITLMMAARELLDISTLKLSDIQENAPILNQQKDIEFKFMLPNDTPPVHYTIKAAKLKLKNYGNFHKMLRDPRLPSLARLRYLINGSTQIDYDELNREFDRFDAVRHNAFKLFHRFEEKFHSDAEKTDGCYKFSTIVMAAPSLTLTERYTLLFIRNGFAHSNYSEFILDRSQMGEISDEEFRKAEEKLKNFRLELSHRQGTIAEELVKKVEEIVNRVCK